MLEALVKQMKIVAKDWDVLYIPLWDVSEAVGGVCPLVGTSPIKVFFFFYKLAISH